MELDPEGQRILDLAREGRTPSVHDKARIERLLGAAVGFAATPALGSTSVAPGAKATAGALALKWGAVAVLVAGAVGGAGYGYERMARPSAAVPAHVPAAVVAARPVVVAPMPAPVVESSEGRSPEPQPPGAALRSGGAVSQRSSMEGTRAGGGTLGAELDLLHEVQAKWRGGDANAALSLLAVHRERYPNSQLGSEREALRVLCLCATGRSDEARRVAHHFLSNAPRSPLRTSVEESCAGK